MDEDRRIESARTLHKTSHAVLAAVIALGLLIWLDVAVFGVAHLFHLNVPEGSAVPIINIALLVFFWLLSYRALRQRANF